MVAKALPSLSSSKAQASTTTASMRPPYPFSRMKSEPVTISAHFSCPQEVELVKKAAKSIGLTPSAFLRQLALEKAIVIADGQSMKRMKKRSHLRVVK